MNTMETPVRHTSGWFPGRASLTSQSAGLAVPTAVYQCHALLLMKKPWPSATPTAVHHLYCTRERCCGHASVSLMQTEALLGAGGGLRQRLG